MVMRLRSRILQAFPLPRRSPHAGLFREIAGQLLAGLLTFFTGCFILISITYQGDVTVPCGRKRKLRKIATHKRKKKLRKNRH